MLKYHKGLSSITTLEKKDILVKKDIKTISC